MYHLKSIKTPIIYITRSAFYHSVVLIIFFVILLSACSSKKIIINSDIVYKQVDPVSLHDYKSVQLRDQKYQDPKLAIGVSVSGGGSRAQYFGLGVLMGIEEIKDSQNRTMLSGVDYFSTASGGGYAVGYYLTMQKNLLLNTNSPYSSFYQYWLSDDRVKKYQEFIWQSAKPSDAIFRFNKNEKDNVSFPYAERLDVQLLQCKRMNSRMVLGDFFVPVNESRLPILPMFVANGTIYKNVERLPFMPHILNALKVNRIIAPSDSTFKKDPAYNFPLCYAIAGSSAFPGLLPQLRLGISADENKVIRVVDGGVVDNLGYRTLIELLEKDNVEASDKRAIIVDCAGVGEIDRYSDDQRISVFNVLENALLFTVDSKYMTRVEDIENKLRPTGIPLSNYVLLSMRTILAKVDRTDTEVQQILASWKSIAGKKESVKESDQRWLKLYKNFEASVKSHCAITPGYVVDDLTWNGNLLRSIDLISFDEMKHFTNADRLMLYELVSQIETKVKIHRSEKIILTLAGRYVAYLEQQKLNQLVTR